MEITATIRPGTNRCQEMRETLEKYRNVIRDFNVLPRVIEEVAALMGIRGFCDSSDARSFALDVLRIDVRGPVGLHLTIVDLPGLISVESDEQSTEDIDAVHRLVETYMESHRTIILAVAQAGNDVANQPVIRKSRKYDPHGLRTIGIITKPDLINKGTENRIARLANNEDSIKLGLGFFLLKNPSPEPVLRLRRPDTPARVRILGYLVDFYDIQWQTWGVFRRRRQSRRRRDLHGRG
ncbi:Interferon-induced GTP-binding protein Mx [Colletotrichum fructicola]|nr:Interferon-induced GTP-binding protein Mx [Colletotrichum fructicola]